MFSPKKETQKYYIVTDLDDINFEPSELFETKEEAVEYITENQGEEVEYTILECVPVMRASLKITLEDIKE